MSKSGKNIVLYAGSLLSILDSFYDTDRVIRSRRRKGFDQLRFSNQNILSEGKNGEVPLTVEQNENIGLLIKREFASLSSSQKKIRRNALAMVGNGHK